MGASILFWPICAGSDTSTFFSSYRYADKQIHAKAKEENSWKYLGMYMLTASGEENKPHWSYKVNGSLFTCLTATVTVNGLENEMSSELPFSRLKMGVESRVNLETEGREDLPLLETPIFDRENGNLREFHFINCLT